MRRGLILLLVISTIIALAGCGGGGGGAHAPRYVLQGLPSTYGYRPLINDAGQIITLDCSGTPGEDPTRPVIVRNPDGSVRNLSSSYPRASWVSGVSSAGHVIGQTDNELIRWDANGNFTRLELPNYSDGHYMLYQPLAVNSAGEVVGYDQNDWIVPMRWDMDGRAIELPMPEGYNTGEASDINDAGIAVGYVDARNYPGEISNLQAAVWDRDGTIRLLHPDSTEHSRAYCINNAGEIAGEDDSGAVVWDMDGNVKRRLGGSPNYEYIQITDMNDSGVVVGYFYNGDDSRAAVWSPSGLPSKLDMLPGDINSMACCINNRGEITGWSSRSEYWTPDLTPDKPIIAVHWVLK